MTRTTLLLLLSATLGLAACQDYTPREKHAVYDPKTGELVPPYPCPDWSKNTIHNYENSNHSNFGCATENNMVIQLNQPSDWYEGHGDNAPDPLIRQKVLDDYYSGKIPVQLQPMQDTSGSGGSSAQ